MALLYLMTSKGDRQRSPVVRAPQHIAAELGRFGVQFEQWPVRTLPPNPTDADVLDGYHEPAAAFTARCGFGRVEVVRMTPDETDPSWALQARRSRDTYFNEHTHTGDETWYFAAGRSAFYLRLDGEDAVHVVVAEAGDLLRVPGGTRHWFDMGLRPDFAALRFYLAETDWDEAFTGDLIAARFPHLEELRAIVV